MAHCADIAAWLRSIKTVTSATPCIVGIKGKAYSAARYTEQLETPQGCDAYARGERTYTRESIYVVGTLPRHYVKRRKAAYVVPGDSREWYIAVYWDGRSNPFDPNWETHKLEYHPFGENFILAPWTHSEAIDAYETRKYDRVPLTIKD